MIAPSWRNVPMLGVRNSHEGKNEIGVGGKRSKEGRPGWEVFVFQWIIGRAQFLR
jgi:hypothetical protein